MYGTNRVNLSFIKKILSIMTALIILSVSSIPITADTPLGGGSGPEPLGGDPATIQEIISKVTEQDVEKYITDLQNFGTRYTYTTECNLSAQYIFDEFSNYSALSVESHYFVYNSYVMRNVIATLPGINASNNEVYVVGGHYDSTSNDDPWNFAPGADDDASGTAVALEAAKILSEYRFEATIKFAAWSAEEVGLIGSQFWAQDAAESEMEIEAYLNFDMIGYDPNNESGLDIRYDTPSQWISDEMVSINADYSIGLNITTIKGGGASDHMSFWQQGFQAVSCIEHEFNTPNYHSPTDTVDKLNMEFDKKVTQLGLATLAKLAGVLTPGVGEVYLDSPAYKPADTVGITLYDTDLNINPSSIETAFVEVSSDTETTPETIILTESGTNTSVFMGSIDLVPGMPISDGDLQVAEGDIITVEYNDDDPIGVRAAYAEVDGTPPIISNVVAQPDVAKATITWTTDEPSDSRIYYGISPSLGEEAYDSNMVTSHSLQILGLEPSLLYYFDVESTDYANNTRRDDNNGDHYSFMTLLGIVSRTNSGYVGYVKESDPSGNYFDGSDILVGYGAQGIYQGAAQFNVTGFPENAQITGANVEFYGKLWIYTGSGGNWFLRMLDDDIDSNWQQHGYTDIHNALIEDTISPTLLNSDLDPRQWNSFTFQSGQFLSLKNHLVNNTLSFRLDGPVSGRYIFDWDTGNGDESYGPEFAPILTIAYNTVSDTKGPLVSDLQITPNPTYGASDVILTAIASDDITGGSNITDARYYDPVLKSWIKLDPEDGLFDSSTENLVKVIDISSWPDDTYEIIIRCLDEAGNWGGTISIVLIKRQTFDLQLTYGWNLISIPLDLTDTSIFKVLESLTGNYDRVEYYDSSDMIDHWKHNNTQKSQNLNDLDDLYHLMGFWVHITEPGGVLLQVPGNPFTENQTITLFPGWNLVGYPSSNNRLRYDALNNLTFGNQVDSIWTFDSITKEWKEIGSLDYFEVGEGYWIFAKSECEWEVPL